MCNLLKLQELSFPTSPQEPSCGICRKEMNLHLKEQQNMDSMSTCHYPVTHKMPQNAQFYLILIDGLKSLGQATVGTCVALATTRSSCHITMAPGVERRN